MSAPNLVVDLAVRYGFQILGALVILAVGWLVARWSGRAADRWLARRAAEPPMRWIIVQAIKIVVLIFALVLALDKFGFQVAPLVAGIGVAGLGLGLAFQGVLSNIVAGLTIIFTKPFRVGEYIKLLGVDGQVTLIELSSTTLTHADRSRIVIPNRKIVGEILHNFGTIRQLPLSVSVGSGANLDAVFSVLREILAASPRVLRDPAPELGIGSLSNSMVTIAVQPWVKVDDYGAAQAELYQAILERFRASGITFPFPQQEVRLLSAS